MAFQEIVQMLQDGELVSAAITNRATGQLDQNIRYLRELFEAAMLGETVFARNRTIETDAKVGMPVFFNAATDRFERGLGQVVNGDDGSLVTSASTQILGIVYRKLNSTKADILLHGTANVSLAEAIEGTIVPGLYHLSNVSPGKLERQRPPVGVTVLQVANENADGSYAVFVSTKFHDLLEAHRHYKFSLVPEPAGDHTPPAPGNRHEITNPDPEIEGWLPADHAVFAGLAPPGAAFGYNLSVSSLRHLWPPLPLEGAYLEWHRATDPELLGMAVPLGTSQLCVIDQNGIWWMSDCYADVPWPVDYVGDSSVSDSVSVVECPRLLFPQLLLWFTKPVFQTSGTCVLSLSAKAGSGLSLVCVDTGEPATRGHLLIDLDLALQVTTQTLPGHIVFKALSSDGRIGAGPVVESLKAGSDNVTLSSNVDLAEDGQAYGRVVISVDQELDGRELGVDTTHLDGAEEEFYLDTIAIGFRSGVAAGLRGRLNVPGDLALPAGTQLKLRFWLLNRSTLDVPAELFSLSYRRMPKPTAVAAVLPLPLQAAEVSLPSLPTALIAVGSAANRYFYVESEPFEIAAGDIVHFSLARSGDSDGFSGNVLLLQQRGLYVVAE